MLGLAACGGSPTPPAPDAPGNDSRELSIALFRHAPFTDGDTENAPMVAIQDGDGAWTAITAERGVYRARVASDRYGVAIACRADDSSRVAVFQRTAADGLELRTRSCGTSAVELVVATSHVPPGWIGYISTTAGSAGGHDSTYAFLAQPGPMEVFASLTDAAGRIGRLVRVPAFDLQVHRDIAIDFATQGRAPEERPLAIEIGAEDRASVTTSVIRPTGEYALHGPAAVGTPATYQVLPLELWETDDLFEVTIEVGSRSSGVASKVPGTLSLQLPPALDARDPEVVVSPFPRPVFSFTTASTELPIQRYTLSARTAGETENSGREWVAELSASWVAAAPVVRYQLPDLSVVSGFAPEFALLDRGEIRWSVRRTETSTAAPSDGRITRGAVQGGAVEGYCGDHVVQPPETCDPPDGASCSAGCAKL